MSKSDIFIMKEVLKAFRPDADKELIDVGELGTTPYPDAITVTDYKVTKKDGFVPLPVQSKEWGCIVEYLTSHYEDIEMGINDFATLRPIMNFISRKSQ